VSAPPRVLVVGPGPGSAGGVWTVIATVLASPLGERLALRHVATHRDGSGREKLTAAAVGVGRVALALLRRQADVVWVHMSADFSFRRKTAVVALARAARLPVMLHVHDGTFDAWYRRAAAPERAVVRTVLRAADVVVALTPSWERRLHDIARCRTTAIMNPVVVPPAPPDDGRVAGRVVAIGRLGEHKGSPVLVRALARIAAGRPEAHLVLAGDGDHEGVRREAERLGVADRVETRAWLSPADVAGLLRTASVFALPSRGEGMPMALLEAMAHALPVVVTPVGGIPDLVREDVHGRFVPPDDPEALAEALDALLADPVRARELGREGRREVERRAAVPVVAEQVERVLLGLIDGAGARGRGRRPAG
jgi:glycosyltransferase involved in cell wall biosynthesis